MTGPHPARSPCYSPRVSRRALDDESLRRALKSPGYRPARAHAGELFDRLAAHDEDAAEAAERALARLCGEAAEGALERFEGALPPARARLCRLIGRVAQASEGGARERLVRFLVEALRDEDKKTRRLAAIALGKLGGAGVPEALLGALSTTPPPAVDEQRSLVEALGKVGDAGALDRLDALAAEDAELLRLIAEARLRLRRTLARAEGAPRGSIDADAAPARPLRVVLRCRRGLAADVAAELGRDFAPVVVDDETVEATLTGPLRTLFRARTALRFLFPLSTGGARDPGDALVTAMTSSEARAIFETFTRGPVRYRIEWASAGRRRGLTYRVAEAIARARPELTNDPTESLWEAVVEEGDGVRVELWPRGLPDPRFTYRRAQVPASSHPTIAAALARAGGVRDDDVVWDPFVGAGTELVERALLGRTRLLVGTDLDRGALEGARANLEAAGIAGATLVCADACAYRPRERPTLVLTNPPMGRRVLDKTKTGPLYAAFLAHVAEVLAPRGRLAWISPRPQDTARLAAEVGLRVLDRRTIDMGGFFAELQLFEAGR